MKKAYKARAAVIYRRGDRFGRISAADYDEAIEALQNAKTQLLPDGRGCLVCGDDGHQAWECHHNPLVIARKSTAYAWFVWDVGKYGTTELRWIAPRVK